MNYRKNSIRGALAAILVVVLILGTGCPQGSQQKAAVAMRDFAYSVQAFQQGETAFFQAGKIDAETHKRFQQGILTMAQLGPQLDAAIAANNKAAVLAAIDSSLSATDDLINRDVVAISDPNTKLEVQTLLLTIRTLLGNGKALVQ